MTNIKIERAYVSDQALIAAEAVIAARDWLDDDAARACLASTALALVDVAREQAAAAGGAYFTTEVLERRLAAIEEKLQAARKV